MMGIRWAFLLMPAMTMAYTPPTKAPSAQAVEKTQLGYGGYGSIMGVEGAQVNYGLPKTNLPAPNMSYGSIKQLPSEPEASVTPAPAPKPQPPPQPKPESTKEMQLPETNYATGGQQKPVEQGKETHVKLPPSYVGYGSIMEKQPAVDQVKVSEPLAPPPPPMNYGSLVSEARESHAVKDEVNQYVAPAVPSPAPETPTPATAPTPTAQAQLSGSYGVPPPVKPQQPQQPAGEDAESSGSSQSHQVPPITGYGSYGYLPLGRQQPKVVMDQVMPKEKATETTTTVETEDTEAETDAPKSVAPTDLSGNEIRENKPEPEPAAPAPAPMPPKACENKSQYCDYWRETGECEKNPAYMKVNCAVSCGGCPAVAA